MQYSINPRVIGFSQNPILAIDASMRFVLGVMLCLCELFAYWVLLHSELNAWYYLRAMIVALVVLALVMRFGDDGLISDIKELCLYDVFAQPLGLCLFGLGAGRFSLILVNAVLVLKIVRLFWPSTGGQSLSWPTFGMLGYLRHRKAAVCELPQGQQRLVWILLLSSPLLGWLIGQLDKVIFLAAWVAVPVLYLLLHARQFFASLGQIATRLRELALERDQAREELLRWQQSGHLVEQQALLRAYFQVHPSMRASLLPIIEEFSEHFPLDDSALDSLGAGSDAGLLAQGGAGTGADAGNAAGVGAGAGAK